MLHMRRTEDNIKYYKRKDKKKDFRNEKTHKYTIYNNYKNARGGNI